MMASLNSTMFYKVKFTISIADPNSDPLWKIIMHIKNWQVKKCFKRHLVLTSNFPDWTRLKYGGQIFSADNSVFFKSEYFYDHEDKSEFWACKVIENLPPIHGYANREWITEIGYEQASKNVAIFSCVVSYSDRAGFIGPYMDIPTSSIPNLIKNLINDKDIHVCCGPDTLTGNAQKLKIGDWPDLYAKIINPERQLPYVFISPQIVNKESHEVTFLVHPDSLADKLFGNAIVFYTPDFEFLQEMQYMNEEYACYGGAIRVYQANTTDPIRHRYLSATDIETYGEEQIVSFLVRAFAQNIHFYDSFFCIEECQKRKEEYNRKKRIDNLKFTHQKQLELAEDEKAISFDLAVQEEEKRLKAEAKVAQLQKDLNIEREKNYRLRTQTESLQAAAAENNSLRLALDARFQAATLPETAEDVVEYFSQVFADKLAFTDDARKSLKTCTLSAIELWKVFFSLANTMYDLYKKVGCGDIFTIFKERTGIEAKRGEGSATRNDKKLMKQFESEINGEIIDIEAHITYPRQRQSIHFGYSSRLEKVIIGHCGEHLNNYSTRKQRR